MEACCLEQVEHAADVGFPSLVWIHLERRQVFQGRCVEDGVGANGGNDLVDPDPVMDVSRNGVRILEQRPSLDRQFSPVEPAFVTMKHEQVGWSELRPLLTSFATDRAARSGDEFTTPVDVARDGGRVDGSRLTAEQVSLSNRSDVGCLDAAEKLIDR